jgi:hypothetical protein
VEIDMPKPFPDKMEEGINEMLEEARKKGFSVREIDADTYLCAAKSVDPKEKDKINFYRIFPNALKRYLDQVPRRNTFKEEFIGFPVEPGANMSSN